MKRLVICCDGTWNRTETRNRARPSNVLRLLRTVVPVASDGTNQVQEYVRGIGTGKLKDRWVGGLTGDGISTNIEQAYQFIANNYSPGDQIFLFGFSRGAFTVRSLSGFLHHIGILKKDALDRFPSCYYKYQTTSKLELARLGDDLGSLVERPNERSVPIYFLGVWDTVGRLGAIPLLTERWVKFHDTDLSPNVTHAYQALATHELRADFKPTLWTSKTSRQEVEQEWFTGSHSDVGGGLADTRLSNTTLAWMIEKAKSAGLEFVTLPVPSSSSPASASQAIEMSCLGVWRLRPWKARTISPAEGPAQLCHHSVGNPPADPGLVFRRKKLRKLFQNAETQARMLQAAASTVAPSTFNTKADEREQGGFIESRINRIREMAKKYHEKYPFTLRRKP